MAALLVSIAYSLMGRRAGQRVARSAAILCLWSMVPTIATMGTALSVATYQVSLFWPDLYHLF